MKKAQGMPITVIIIAVLGLVVLFVLLGIFGFRAQKFGKEVGGAAEQVCPEQNIMSMADCEKLGGESQLGSYVRADKTRLGFMEVCCSKYSS